MGLGRLVGRERTSAAIDGAAPVFQAPEVASGGQPSVMGDYVALLQFSRWLLPYIELPAPLARIVRGELRDDDGPLLAALHWVNVHVLSAPPPLRATLDEAIEVANRIRQLLGVTLDFAGFAQHVAGVLRDAASTSNDEDRQPIVLAIGLDAVWFAVDGHPRVRLGRAQRRVLLALLARREHASDSALSIWELFEAGWPGQQPVATTGANRVYVTLNRMRDAGLRDVIERFEDGYRIARGVVVEPVAATDEADTATGPGTISD